MTPELRSLFPITKRAIYVNHAAVSPLPTPTVEAIEAQLRDVRDNGSINFRSWIAVKERARAFLAELLGARPGQVAFMRNTSDSLSTVANGISWQPGENVVTFRGEFPANIYPWLRLREAFGVEVRMCEERDGRVDMEELETLVDTNTRVIAISHVQYASGFCVDLERLGRIARQRDALLVVDMIQSLGVLPLDVEDQLIDVAAGASHKWLLGPEGIGYLYLSDRARERIEPTLVGWISVPNPEDYNNLEQDWNVGTLAWETGTGPAALLHGLNASLELLRATGPKQIANYLERLTDYLCEGVKAKNYRVLSARDAGRKSQIVCIQHVGGLSALQLYGKLKSNNIITAPRNNRLRIAPHFYNSFEEMDQIVAALPT